MSEDKIQGSDGHADPSPVHREAMLWRLRITLRSLIVIETTVQSSAELDRLRAAIESDAVRSFWRRPLHTWRIGGEPCDIVFRLSDVLTVASERVQA
jgi:hypothetical protein